MTTHTDVEEKMKKIVEGGHLGSATIADIRQALTEMKEAGARDERHQWLKHPLYRRIQDRIEELKKVPQEIPITTYTGMIAKVKIEALEEVLGVTEL
jgi:hypothetical protein